MSETRGERDAVLAGVSTCVTRDECMVSNHDEREGGSRQVEEQTKMIDWGAVEVKATMGWVELECVCVLGGSITTQVNERISVNNIGAILVQSFGTNAPHLIMWGMLTHSSSENWRTLRSSSG